MPNRYAKRKDVTHNAIQQALADAGYIVEDTSWMGRGWQDITAASLCEPTPLVLFVEAKSAGGKLSDAEAKLHARFPANWIIADSGACAITQANEIRARHLGIKHA